VTSQRDNSREAGVGQGSVPTRTPHLVIFYPTGLGIFAEGGHMQAADEARRPRAQTGGYGRWRFLLRYLELVAAMLVGMVVLGWALRAVLMLAGLRYPSQYPELVALEMAVTMPAGVVAWMRYRRHRWAVILEIVGAMVAPAVALVPLLWLGVLTGEALFLLDHVAMGALVLLVMLRRRGEYQGAPGHRGTPRSQPPAAEGSARWPMFHLAPGGTLR
jgi:hypothetical protein